MRLEGKVGVITGAASGIGRSMAKLFAAEGAKVILADINEAKLSKVADTITAAGGTCAIKLTDVSHKTQCEAMIDEATGKWDKIDFLCNNAGILDGLTPLDQVTDEAWDKIMKINVDGPMYATRKAIPSMLEQGSGAILNTCSAAALAGGRGGCAYTTSKHALLGFTRSVAWFYGPKGVRCNAIAPGAIATAMHGSVAFNSDGMGRWQPYFPTIPPHGKALEVANVALMLISDEGAYVNGTCVPVDGGWMSY